jgi:CHAT domain-containing protein
VGLARAFQIAGARTVAASLWSVSDRSTKELMTRFYGGLAHGQRKDDALRIAQRALIAGEAGAAFAHPWHWAAFELLGEGR